MQLNDTQCVQGKEGPTKEPGVGWGGAVIKRQAQGREESCERDGEGQNQKSPLQNAGVHWQRTKDISKSKEEQRPNVTERLRRTRSVLLTVLPHRRHSPLGDCAFTHPSV